jgi:proteasome accessory factor C
MLAIVPYLVKNPGTSVEEVSRLFEVDPRELTRDLELLFMAGLPPYGPGDLIDVDVDADGQIWISMADHFARPLRLTRQEALAVLLRATELAATPGVPQAPALESALEKLRRSLDEVGGIEHGPAVEPPAFLDAVRAAAESLRRLRIDYVAASSRDRAWRTIDPEQVFAEGGSWYVVAWDVDADAERMFRIDRVAQVQETAETFEPRGLRGAGRPLYSPGSHDVQVTLLLHPPARWVAEYYVTAAVSERPDGDLEATFPAGHTAWLAALLLSLGPDAEVIEPASLNDEVRELASRTLALYRS